MRSPDDVIATFRSFGVSADHADYAMGQVLLAMPHQHAVVWLLLGNAELVRYMLSDAEGVVVVVTPSAVRIGAYYPPIDTFPLPRVYGYDLAPEPGRIVAEFLKDQNPMSRQDVEGSAPQGDPQALVTAYATRQSAHSQEVVALVEGRREQTTTSGATYLRTGLCLPHRKKPIGIVMRTFEAQGRTLTAAFDACEDCSRDTGESGNRTPFESFAAALGVDLPRTRSTSLEEAVSDAIKVIENELQSTVVKVHETTITARRASGYWLVIRVRDPLNYAYTLQDKDRKDRFRFDAAPDHPELAFQPDHEHPNLRTNRSKKKVRESFLLGILRHDVPALLKRIQEEEATST